MSDNYDSADDEPTADSTDTHYVLGGDDSAAAIARRLRDDGHTVTLVDDAVDPPDVPSVDARPTDFAALREAGIADAAAVVVAAESDRRALLLAQRVRSRFEEPRVIVVVGTAGRVDAFADAGHEVVCATSAVSAAVAERV